MVVSSLHGSTKTCGKYETFVSCSLLHTIPKQRSRRTVQHNNSLRSKNLHRRPPAWLGLKLIRINIQLNMPTSVLYAPSSVWTRRFKSPMTAINEKQALDMSTTCRIEDQMEIMYTKTLGEARKGLETAQNTTKETTINLYDVIHKISPQPQRLLRRIKGDCTENRHKITPIAKSLFKSKSGDTDLKTILGIRPYNNVENYQSIDLLKHQSKQQTPPDSSFDDHQRARVRLWRLWGRQHDTNMHIT